MPKVSLSELTNEEWEEILQERASRHAQWIRQDIKRTVYEVTNYVTKRIRKGEETYICERANAIELLILDSKLDPELSLPLAAAEYFHYNPLDR